MDDPPFVSVGASGLPLLREVPLDWLVVELFDSSIRDQANLAALLCVLGFTCGGALVDSVPTETDEVAVVVDSRCPEVVAAAAAALREIASAGVLDADAYYDCLQDALQGAWEDMPLPARVSLCRQIRAPVSAAREWAVPHCAHAELTERVDRPRLPKGG